MKQRNNYCMIVTLCLGLPLCLEGTHVPQKKRSQRSATDLELQIMNKAEEGILDRSSLQLYLKWGADLNAQDHNYETALMRATYKNRLEIVKMLIAAHADVNIKDFQGSTALHYAAEGGHTEIARALIKAGSFVNSANNYVKTPLMMAAKNGHAEIVRILLEAGADVHAKDKNKMTALMMSAKKGYPDVVQELIAAGADINDKNTALMMATQNSHSDVVQILIAAGVDVNATTTALRLAVEKCPIGKDIIQTLVASGADHQIGTIREEEKKIYDQAVAAGLAERKAYHARRIQAKKVIEEQKQLDPYISEMISDYAYSESPIDLPEIKKREKQKESRCILQ